MNENSNGKEILQVNNDDSKALVKYNGENEINRKKMLQAFDIMNKESDDTTIHYLYNIIFQLKHKEETIKRENYIVNYYLTL